MSLTNNDVKDIQKIIDYTFENVSRLISDTPESLRIEINRIDEQIHKLNELSVLLKQSPEENINLQKLLKCGQSLEIIITDLEIRKGKCELKYRNYLDNHVSGKNRKADLWLELNYSKSFRQIINKLIDAGYVEETEKGFNWKKSQALLAKLFREYGGWEKGIKEYFTVNSKYPENIDVEYRKDTIPRDWNDLEILLSD